MTNIAQIYEIELISNLVFKAMSSKYVLPSRLPNVRSVLSLENFGGLRARYQTLGTSTLQAPAFNEITFVLSRNSMEHLD